jgi:HSP20 family protein
LNAYEEGDHYVVEAQLPGMKPDDINVSIEQGVLTIGGETKAEEERQDRNYLIREHRAGRFSRSLRLPDTVDPAAVQATYQDGVLRLTLAKGERAKAHRIQIETSDRSPLRGAEHAV